MSKGLDCYSPATSLATNIKNAGYSFVCRYYSSNTAKNLTKGEALAFSNNGLFNVAVWESGSPTSGSYFSYSKGVSDAQSAYNYANTSITQPAGTCIYFAVDFDAVSTSDLTAISEYFRGVVAEFSTLGNKYLIGVYGSGKVCDYVKSKYASVALSWLSGSKGWSGYSTYTGWAIKQDTTNTVTIGGITFDADTNNGTYGGFQVSL